MAELKGYKCPNCGQMLPISQGRIFKCEYCGSEYEKEDDWLKPLKVEVCQAKLVNLDFKTKLNDVYLKDEQIKEKYMNVLSDKYLGRDGYAEFSDEWHECNTVCQFCENESGKSC